MKKVIALLLALVLVLSMAACTIEVHNYSNAGGPDATGTNSGGASPSGTNTPSNAGGSIKLFNGKIEIDPALQNLAKAYEAETGVHVEIESLGGGVDLQATLKQYYQGGNMPDIFVGEGAEDFNNWTGMMADMKDEAWAQDTEAEFVDDTGATIGFPYTTEAIGLAYNKSILEKAGVDPASITGPESMRAAFEALDAKKEELGLTAVVGYCAESSSLYWSCAQHVFGNYLDAGLDRSDTTYIDLLMGEGHKLDETRFTHFAEMLALFHEFSDPSLLVSGTYDQQVMNFAAGKYAFVTQGSWIGASMKDAYKGEYEAAGSFECGYVPYAFEEGIDTILTNSPSWWAVYKDGNVDAAKAFLQWGQHRRRPEVHGRGGRLRQPLRLLHPGRRRSFRRGHRRVHRRRQDLQLALAGPAGQPRAGLHRHHLPGLRRRQAGHRRLRLHHAAGHCELLQRLGLLILT